MLVSYPLFLSCLFLLTTLSHVRLVMAMQKEKRKKRRSELSQKVAMLNILHNVIATEDLL